MDDWDNSDEFIQKLDFSSSDEESEDRSVHVEDALSSSPPRSCEFQKWQESSPLPASPQRKLSEIFLSRTKAWVTPTLKTSPAVSKSRGNAETPLHITWKKLQLCDTPYTPKVRACINLCLSRQGLWHHRGFTVWVVRRSAASSVESTFFVLVLLAFYSFLKNMDCELLNYGMVIMWV